MKRFLTLCLILIGALGALPLSAKAPMGSSLGILGKPTEAKLAEMRAAGIEYVEVTFHSFTHRNCDEECYAEAFALRSRIEKCGLKVWSCHLPFGRKCDISVLDPAVREAHVAYIERMIRLASIFKPRRLVLHPASRPLDEKDRAAREQCAANSICRLSIAAREIGAVLCIENMPHSIGRTGAEMLRLIEGCPEAMVCMDMNHLLSESHAEFIRTVGSRIATIHMSDYDGADERHWCPGKGCIDWPALRRNLLDAGYKGAFIFEVHHGEATCADLVDAYKNVICKGVRK